MELNKEKIISIILGLFLFVLGIISIFGYFIIENQNSKITNLKNKENTLHQKYQEIIKKQKRNIKKIKHNFQFVKEFKDKKQNVSLIEIKDFLEYIILKNSNEQSITIQKENNTMKFSSTEKEDVTNFLITIGKYKKYFKEFSWDSVNYDETTKLYSTTVGFNIGEIRCYLLNKNNINTLNYYSLIFNKNNYNEILNSCNNNENKKNNDKTNNEKE